MAINLRVEATVVDITHDRPTNADAMLVDTQVWYWLAYTRASSAGMPPLPYQLSSYPPYVVIARQGGARLHWCGLSLAELAHLIEQCEREIATTTGSVPPGLRAKEYRHNYPALRSSTTAEVAAAWGIVDSIGLPLDLLVDQSATVDALHSLAQIAVDGYDLFLLQAAAKAGLTQILTDDSDYATVPDITILTGNRTIINAARTQGKLLQR